MNDQPSMAADFVQEAVKSTPPVTVATTGALGLVDWPTWVAMLTVAYLLLQISFLLWKMVDRFNGKIEP